MNTGGVWMLLALAALVVATGLPVWALLIGVASAACAVGLGLGVFDGGILSAAGPRIVNLLEHDLLQAMPLYFFIGVLLQRLAVADALFACALRLFRPLHGEAPLAALAVGTLIAPMNGSVASSSALLSRLVAAASCDRLSVGWRALKAVSTRNAFSTDCTKSGSARAPSSSASV